MAFTTPQFLREHRDEIIHEWEALASAEETAVSLKDAVLRDDLPALLDDLADWVEGGSSAEQHLRAVAGRHASARLSCSYELPQLVNELRLLRETILRLLLATEASQQALTGSNQMPERVVELARLNAGLDLAIADVVERFVAERDRTIGDLAALQRRYAKLFDAIGEGFCLVEVLFDEGRPIDYRFVETNPAFERQSGIPDAVGRRMREIAPEHEDYWFETYGRVALTGEPVRFQDRAEALGRVFDVHAFRFGEPQERRVAILFDDITGRIRSEEALRESQRRLEAERARLQAIIDTIPAGLFIAEAHGKVVLTNDEAKRIWAGAVPLETIGDYAAYPGFWPQNGERLKPEDWPGAQALLHGRKTKGVVVDIERFDGTRGTIVFSGAPISDANGATTGAVVAIHDISELRAAQTRLQEVNERTTQFLAMLSHELRNPLAPIRNGIYLLEHADPGSATAARAREVLARQSDHLTRLVDDLLDVTRISHGKIVLHREVLDLRDVARRTADDLRSAFDDGGVELRIENSAGPVRVDGDPTRLGQVLGNLLQNAAKFTPRGGLVTVGVSASNGEAVLAVCDTGAGMPPHELERMFEPFAQAEQGMARTKGGLGLGLALVRGLVEQHGGTVRASSAGLGHGSEFVVRLPLAAPDSTSARAPDVARPTVSRLVLVIEDNADAGQSLADVLELAGHRIHVAPDGRSGLALAREIVPDVILCDIGLPDIDGYEVARQARRDPALGNTRLVALTGYAQPEDRQRALDAGFEAHLPKPPPLERLEALLRSGRPSGGVTQRSS